MTDIQTKIIQLGHKELFSIIIVILLLTDLAILLDIPFLRQIMGFLFLTILPGVLILQILKLDKLEFTEKFVLMWGLSISFLLFFGLLINNTLLSIGYETPLSTIPLLITFNIAFIILALIRYKTNKKPLLSIPNLNLSTSEKAFLIVPILFPALSILGTHFMKTTDNNVILMFFLFLIPIYVAFVCFFNHKFPRRLYPVVIFLISISLLLIFMLRFPHIHGHDVHTEYGYLFQMTLDKLHWGILGHSALDACLSISLLPTIFQSIMNVNAQEYLFKGVYVTVCSSTPLAVYVISKKYVDNLYAFLASFFFISQATFLVTAGSPRTNIAIFFLALAVMVYFCGKIDLLKRKILFIVFMLSLVVSHYATTYIFFCIMLFSWSGVEILSRRWVFKKSITLTVVLLLFAFLFYWYSQVTETTFNSGVIFLKDTFLNLNKFFIEESRAGMVKQLAGQELAYPILSRANLTFTWGTFILIGIGVLTLLIRYKEMVFMSNTKHKNPDFLKTKFEMEYLVMTLASAGLLVLMIALPFVSIGYGIQRLYTLVLVILSVFFVIGGLTLANLSLKQTFKKSSIKKAQQNPFRKRGDGKSASEVRAYLIILVILIPYFLFVTGAMYQLCGAPVATTLNSEGVEYDRECVRDSESCAAKWLSMVGEEGSYINTPDSYSKMRLISQSKISPSRITSHYFYRHLEREGYIYLSFNNAVNGKFKLGNRSCNMTEYSAMFTGKDMIYDDGGSEIHR